VQETAIRQALPCTCATALACTCPPPLRPRTRVPCTEAPCVQVRTTAAAAADDDDAAAAPPPCANENTPKSRVHVHVHSCRRTLTVRSPHIFLALAPACNGLHRVSQKGNRERERSLPGSLSFHRATRVLRAKQRAWRRWVGTTGAPRVLIWNPCRPKVHAGVCRVPGYTCTDLAAAVELSSWTTLAGGTVACLAAGVEYHGTMASATRCSPCTTTRTCTVSQLQQASL
jgi:hypothetical protein